ncbi:MAG: alpha/beta fold hydrolase [Mycobacteriaceae bacterium]|nr:alpha/beta fold hydrolase [Mycobacteriaceae bacterium]
MTARRLLVAACTVPALVAPVLAAAPQAAAQPGLRWGPCPVDAHVTAAPARCATLSVPMDYTRPTGRRISIMISRIPAENQAGKLGVLFGNPGGPGGDGLDYWSARRQSLPARLHREFDEIAVQPRGLRWSTPLNCAAPGAGLVSAVSGAPLVVGGRGVCEAHDPSYPRTVTTENTARDMDQVRRALGVSKISYLGGSYGTYLGAVYATLFPAHTDKLVLDSNVHPDWIWQREFVEQQLGRKRRLEDMFDWIAAHNRVYRLGGSRAVVAAEWARQVGMQGGGAFARLDPGIAAPGNPLDPVLADIVANRFRLSREQLGRLANIVRTLTEPTAGGGSMTFKATTMATYARKTWPYLAQGMREYRDNPRNLRFLRFLSGMDGLSAPSRRWVFTAITCNENDNRPDPDAMAAALGGFLTGAGVFDITAALLRTGVGCSGWEQSAIPVHVSGRALAVPPMLLQSEHDSATVAAGGPAMAAAMRGRLVRVAGGDHGLVGRGDRTLDQAVLNYLETGRITITHADQAPIPVPDPPRVLPKSQ